MIIKKILKLFKKNKMENIDMGLSNNDSIRRFRVKRIYEYHELIGKILFMVANSPFESIVHYLDDQDNELNILIRIYEKGVEADEKEDHKNSL